MSAGDWKNCRRILCVRPDNLGDLVMTTPALRALRTAVPGRTLTLLASSVGAALAPHLPDIDDCIRFDAPWYKHDIQDSPAQLASLIETLRERDFDAAVIFTVFSQSPLPSAMLCHMAGIRRVAAYCRENPYALICDWIPDTEPFNGMPHEVERQLRLVSRVGAVPDDARLSVKVKRRDRGQVDAVLEELELADGDRWVLMHPGASEEKRRYPGERYAAVARRLWKRHGVRTVISGSAAEAPLAASIAEGAGHGATSVAGRFSLGEFIALIERAPLLVSNNTGPVHLAAALGTPVVVMYALTNPQHTPWQVPHRVLYFDVPPGLESRNVLVRLGARHAFPEPAGLPEPGQVVAAIVELLEEEEVTLTMNNASLPVSSHAAGFDGVAP